MDGKPYNNTLNDYYYQRQLRKYLIQFMAIFSGMQVSVGENDNDSETNLVRVPIVSGSRDRVVAAIMSSNSPNVPVRLPMMSAHITGLQLATDRMKGQGTNLAEVTMKRGGVFPDDLRTVNKKMPIPYYVQAELSILTSNTHHKYEILEQIMLLFRPDLWFNTSDDPHDWTAINAIRLNDLTLEENYPAGSEPRILGTTLNFQFLAYMSAPAVIRDNVIQKIKVRINAVKNSTTIDEFREYVASIDPNERVDNVYDVTEISDMPKQ